MINGINDGEPTKNKTGFSIEQLTKMKKQQLLNIFDSNSSGAISDKEITLKGIDGEELATIRAHMNSVGIEQNLTGFLIEELKIMTDQQLLAIFDGNNSRSISDRELAAKEIEGEDLAELKAHISSLGIAKREWGTFEGGIGFDP